MKSLRKVKFFIKNPNIHIGEITLTGEPTEEETKERTGLFHEWGKKIIPDLETGNTNVTTLAIIEEMSSGKVYMIEPENVKFEINQYDI